MLMLSELPRITGGSWLVAPKADSRISGAAFDTRKIDGEHLFVALQGDNADGHDHLDKLVGTAVKAAIIARDPGSRPPGVALIKVNDPLKALWDIAAERHRRFTGKTVAITGSNGKTTAKTWLAKVLGEEIPLHYSAGSFNNHIGCPVTVMGLQPEHKLLILEIGANALGEIDALTGLFPPDIAVITNIGYAHVGKFGGIANTYLAKLEITNHLKPGGCVFIPQHDAKLGSMVTERISGISGARVARFPAHQSEVLSSNPEGQTIRLTRGADKITVSAAIHGAYAASVFSLIYAIGETLGLPVDRFADHLGRLESVKGRMNRRQALNGATVVDDSYNANPNSFAHLLSVMSQWHFAKKYLVMGDMAELDEDWDNAAAVIAAGLNDTRICLLSLGPVAHAITRKLRELTGCEAVFFDDRETLTAFCREADQPQVLFGIKGSNGAKMWLVSDALCRADLSAKKTD